MSKVLCWMADSLTVIGEVVGWVLLKVLVSVENVEGVGWC